VLRVRLFLISAAFGLAAAAVSLFALNRSQLMVTVTSTSSVSEVMLPLGFWALAVMWMAAAIAMRPAPARVVAYRCLGVGAALHLLLLIAMFVPRLNDREAFSSGLYLMYARVFCVGTVALATAWVIEWARRSAASASAISALDAPLVFGWMAVAAALSRYNLVMAVAGLVAGVALVSAFRGAAASMLRTFAHDERLFLAVVFLAALGLRLLYVHRIMGDPNYLDTGADGRIYDTLAWSVASGSGVPAAFTARYPLLLLGYVWFLAAIYKIAGHSYLVAVTAQSILGAATCLLIYGVAKKVFDDAIGRVAAVFTALSFSLIFAAAALGHQAIDVFLTALIVWMLLDAIGTQEARRWAAIGVVMGLTVAVRETAVFFAAFVMAWIAYVDPRGWRASAPAVASFALGAAIVVLPFVAPKVWSADDRREVRAHFDRLYRGQAEAQPVRGDLVGPLADPAGAAAQFTAHPAHVAGTLARAYARNFAVQFLTQPYGGFDLVFLRKGSEFYYGMWFYAYALAIAGTWFAIRLIPAGGFTAAGIILILGLIASRTLPHIILESDYRHRVPIEPFLILLASVGAVSIAREVIATAASAMISGFTGSDWRVSQSSGT
jgi:hypothetical protein